jgi:hypothetical protein
MRRAEERWKGKERRQNRPNVLDQVWKWSSKTVFDENSKGISSLPDWSSLYIQFFNVHNEQTRTMFV